MAVLLLVFKVAAGVRAGKSASRALRGGSWNNNARNARAANRNENDRGNRNNNIGFRCRA